MNMNKSTKVTTPTEWVVICRVPSEESAYLYFFLELFEGIFNFSTQNHIPGEKARNLVCITNSSLLDIAKLFIEDLKQVLQIEIVEDWHPVDSNYVVK